MLARVKHELCFLSFTSVLLFPCISDLDCGTIQSLWICENIKESDRQEVAEKIEARINPASAKGVKGLVVKVHVP